VGYYPPLPPVRGAVI